MKSHIYWPYICVAYVSLFALGLLDNARGPYLPDITKDLGFTDTQGALLFAIPSCFSFIGCQLCKALVYRMSPVHGICCGLFLMGCGFIALANIHDLVGLALGGGIFGLGFGLVSVFEHVVVQTGSPLSVRRRLLAGLHSMYALASLTSPLLIKQFYVFGWTWRQGFFFVACVPLMASFLLMFLKTDGSMPEDTRPSHKDPLSYLLHYIYMGLILAFYVGGELVVSSRIILYVRRYTETTPEQATYYLATFFLLLLLGRVFFIIFDSGLWKSEKILMWSLSLSFLSFACGLWWSPWWMSLCGLFMAPCFATLMEYIFEIFQDRIPQAMTYVMGIGSLLVFPMHYMVGVATDLVGLRWAMTIGPIFLILSILMLKLRRHIFKEALT